MRVKVKKIKVPLSTKGWLINLVIEEDYRSYKWGNKGKKYTTRREFNLEVYEAQRIIDALQKEL